MDAVLAIGRARVVQGFELRAFTGGHEVDAAHGDGQGEAGSSVEAEMGCGRPAADGDDAHSAAAVKHRIRMLVDLEPCDAVLSDDALVALLRQDGIEIARRVQSPDRGLPRIPRPDDRGGERR